jgi:predicted phage tail protein
MYVGELEDAKGAMCLKMISEKKIARRKEKRKVHQVMNGVMRISYRRTGRWMIQPIAGRKKSGYTRVIPGALLVSCSTFLPL